jgi:putative oxidoreductase
MKLGRLLLRASVGGFFIGHGTQKLFGWFGGYGLKATSDAFEGMGMRPGRAHATAAGVAETAGGAGLLLGARTPLSASVLIATMLTAINRVHLKNGPWVTKGGYEYNVVLIAAALALAEAGPGPLSVDRLRGREHSGDGWALLALALGAAGAAGAHALASSQPPAAVEPAPPAPAPTPAPANTVEPAHEANDEPAHEASAPDSEATPSEPVIDVTTTDAVSGDTTAEVPSAEE